MDSKHQEPIPQNLAQTTECRVLLEPLTYTWRFFIYKRWKLWRESQSQLQASLRGYRKPFNPPLHTAFTWGEAELASNLPQPWAHDDNVKAIWVCCVHRCLREYTSIAWNAEFFQLAPCLNTLWHLEKLANVPLAFHDRFARVIWQLNAQQGGIENMLLRASRG